jgi:hypothetical protein
MTDQAKKANKFLRKKFTAAGHKDLRILIVKNYSEKIDLVEEYIKMVAWCATKHKTPSIMRYNNWIKRSIQFKDQRRGVSMTDLDELEVQTKKRLSELDAPKWQ